MNNEKLNCINIKFIYKYIAILQQIKFSEAFKYSETKTDESPPMILKRYNLWCIIK